MPEPFAAILGWVIPVVVVFGLTAIAVSVAAWAVRRARRSPRARAAAAAVRDTAGASLVRLDDAVAELDLEVGLSGALYGGGAPASLRRARITAQHVRDESFDEYRTITGDDVLPADVRAVAARIERRTAESLATIARARAEHRGWMQAHVTAADQVSAARSRLAHLRASLGDPAALVAQLAAAYDESEWQQASRIAAALSAQTAEAARHLDAAAAAAADPTRDALGELASAERALRAAEADGRLLEETHRLAVQAAQALPGEFEAARSALRQALATREHLEPADADRLADEIRAVEAELTALEPDAARRPARTVEAIARLRSRLDLALGDARTAQQRLRGARTALPGALAAARNAIAVAEASLIRARGDAAARVRLMSAQHELAAARQAQDPVEALDAARRAMRLAEDAKALADYARLAAR